MNQAVVECVPNFSEGRDKNIINKIAAVIQASQGVKLLDVDPGEATNRTVMTFVGSPEAVVEAAFRAVQRASELIDMRHQRGTHPRLGATDVLPLIPISGITLAQCAALARALAQRIAEELTIPTYCYQEAAFAPSRRNLAHCRRGQYEGLAERLLDPMEAPDFGARPLDEVIARAGATNVGARNFLIAVNFNLDSTSVPLASAIAAELRHSGRRVATNSGERITIPGALEECKAIGWFIEEYNLAQVSVNLTNIEVTSLHQTFDCICTIAAKHGAKILGTEIIGLVPRRVLIEAGRHYSTEEVPDAQAITVAIDTLRLSHLRPFIASEKILEERMKL